MRLDLEKGFQTRKGNSSFVLCAIRSNYKVPSRGTKVTSLHFSRITSGVVQRLDHEEPKVKVARRREGKRRQ